MMTLSATNYRKQLKTVSCAIRCLPRITQCKNRPFSNPPPTPPYTYITRYDTGHCLRKLLYKTSLVTIPYFLKHLNGRSITFEIRTSETFNFNHRAPLYSHFWLCPHIRQYDDALKFCDNISNGSAVMLTHIPQKSAHSIMLTLPNPTAYNTI